jgi:hypothetical protein
MKRAMKSREKRKVVIRKVPVKYLHWLPYHEDHEGRIEKFSRPLFVIFVVDIALPGPYA